MTSVRVKAILCIPLLWILAIWGYLTFIAYQQSERIREAAASGLAVDAPIYSPAGYHLFALLLLLAILFAKRFVIASVLGTGYLGIHAYAVYHWFQTCFLGEYLCPDVPFWTKVSDRFTWLDWSTTLFLPLICISVIYLALRERRRRGLA